MKVEGEEVAVSLPVVQVNYVTSDWLLVNLYKFCNFERSYVVWSGSGNYETEGLRQLAILLKNQLMTVVDLKV